MLFGYFYGGFLVSEVYVVFNFDVFVIFFVVISMLSVVNGINVYFGGFLLSIILYNMVVFLLLSFFNGVICKLESFIMLS